jgi:hypothetical protein
MSMSSTPSGAGSRRIVIAAGVVAVAEIVFTATSLGSFRGSMALLPLVVAAGCWVTVACQARIVRAANRRDLVDHRVSTVPPSPARGVQPSPAMHKATKLAHQGRSARYVARTCGMPIALAELIVAEARRTDPTPPEMPGT